jgi:hypothetical protein
MKYKNIIVLTNNLDSDGDKFDIEKIELPDIVPLLKNFNGAYKIGDCILSKKDGNVVAEFITPVDIDESLYPAIQFKVNEQDLKLHEETGVWDIDNIDIKAIGLCENHNCDESIKCLSDQMNRGILINKEGATKIPNVPKEERENN